METGTYKTHCGKSIKPGEHCCNNPCCYACPYSVEEMEQYDAGREACDERMKEFGLIEYTLADLEKFLSN